MPHDYARSPTVEGDSPAPIRQICERVPTDAHSSRIAYGLQLQMVRRHTPAHRKETKREVDVSAVERKSFIEATCVAPTRTGDTRRRLHPATREVARRSWPHAWLAAEPDELRESHVERKPDAVDCLFVGLQCQWGDRADPLVALERCDDVLEEVGPAESIVVQKHDHVSVALHTPRFVAVA